MEQKERGWVVGVAWDDIERSNLFALFLESPKLFSASGHPVAATAAQTQRPQAAGRVYQRAPSRRKEKKLLLLLKRAGGQQDIRQAQILDLDM